ncbi:Uncharacterised protein [Mycobacteroides abscessus subsp. abscessus]|nr:Uncharacterised protein [Mycobacteroides abscessus subsp. abscessus]
MYVRVSPLALVVTVQVSDAVSKSAAVTVTPKSIWS